MNADAVDQPIETAVGSGHVVAIVAAFDRADTIADTVRSLVETASIDRVVVVDDGSSDDTAVRARAAGAHVVVLPTNLGKGAAVTAGIRAATDAVVYVLIDADLRVDAGRVAAHVLAPVMADTADMAIAVPPVAGRGGGLGFVKRFAARGIATSCGFTATAPLSGQRAVRGDVLRRLAGVGANAAPDATLGDRFGLETALTIDAVRDGARVMETPVAFDHRYTGRSVGGFVHRARQGVHIARALWWRRTGARRRGVLVVAGGLVLLAVALVLAPILEPRADPRTAKASKVLIFGMSRLALGDVGTGAAPTLDRLWSAGAAAATSVRTLSGSPSTVEGYATLGAGARVRARDEAADAFASEEVIGADDTTAKQAATVRTGVVPSGDIVVVGAATTVRRNEHRFLPSLPGALGDALRAARKATAVVGNSDLGNRESDRSAPRQRPIAVALMDTVGAVSFGDVGPSLLTTDPAWPYGVRADRVAVRATVREVLRTSDVVLVDPGDLDRAAAFRGEATEAQAETLRLRALRSTDDILTDVVRDLPEDALLIVTAVRPPTATWELTPMLLYGAGVRPGWLASTSTRRLGLVTLTDIAPTVLDAFGVPTPDGMIGHPLRMGGGKSDLVRLRAMNDLAGYRERLYLPLTKGFVIFQAILYLLTILVFSMRGGVGRVAKLVSFIVLAIAGLPLATFVFRALPHAWSLGPFGVPVILVLDALIVAIAMRARRHALSPLQWVIGATVALLVLDVSTGARLQQSSVLGYSPHTAARFVGVGNTAFGALAATTVLWCAIHVHAARRRSEAVLTAAVVCVVVLAVDGAPSLGSDVGGILTFVPTFGLLLVVLSGRRLSARTLVISAASTALLLAVATGVDLLRPAQERTHLGRFVASLFNGDSTSLNTIGRKATTNLRILGNSFWTWVVPIIAVVMLFFLVLQRGWERLVPRGSALRAGVTGALFAGLLGFAVNDSGVVVTALVFVYIGPYLTLLAIDREQALAP